mmetsp:Transcript_25214/g.42538  ORF Transcript_25214/g.42538 Transcript_25214/m.42538 type:complete len:238 (-) Transcript_25214:39-752(-)
MQRTVEQQIQHDKTLLIYKPDYTPNTPTSPFTQKLYIKSNHNQLLTAYHEKSKCSELVSRDTSHDVKEVGVGCTLGVDGENHAIGVESRAKVELKLAEVLQQVLGNTRGSGHESLDLRLRDTLLLLKSSDLLHVLLQPVLEVHSAANLSLGVVETINDVVHHLNGVVGLLITTISTKRVSTTNVNILTTLGDLTRFAHHESLNGVTLLIDNREKGVGIREKLVAGNVAHVHNHDVKD